MCSLKWFTSAELAAAAALQQIDLVHTEDRRASPGTTDLLVAIKKKKKKKDWQSRTPASAAAVSEFDVKMSSSVEKKV